MILFYNRKDKMSIFFLRPKKIIDFPPVSPGGGIEKNQKKRYKKDMSDKNDLLLQKISEKAAETAEAIRSFKDPEMLVKAVKTVKKQIPFRFRRYAAAYLLFNAVCGESAGTANKSHSPEKSAPTTDGFVNLFVGAGKIHGITPGQLSRHFGKILDIPLTKIATVRILPAFSFIEIEKSEAERAISEVNNTVLNNKKLTVSTARKNKSAPEKPKN